MPWQIDVLKKLQGFKPGEMAIMMSGRGVGKSTFSAQAMKRLWEDIAWSSVQNIVLAEGTVYGSRYYTAEPVGGNWHEMTTWCYEMFGDTSSIWSETKNLAPEPLKRWYVNNRKFWFRDEVDRTIFILKWR